MDCLGDEDGAGDGEVGLAGDGGGGAEVGGHAETLDDGGHLQEGGDVGVGEVVGAGGDWLGSCGGEAGGEGGDVGFFVVGNVLELVVEGAWVAGCHEVGGSPLGDGLLVEAEEGGLVYVCVCMCVLLSAYMFSRCSRVRANWRMSASVRAARFSTGAAWAVMAKRPATAVAMYFMLIDDCEGGR